MKGFEATNNAAAITKATLCRKTCCCSRTRTTPGDRRFWLRCGAGGGKPKSVHTAATVPVVVVRQLAINTYSTLVAARVPHHLLLLLVVVGGHHLLVRMHRVHLVHRIGVRQMGQRHLLNDGRVHLLLHRLLLLAAQLLRRLGKVRHAGAQTAVVGIIWRGGRGKRC